MKEKCNIYLLSGNISMDFKVNYCFSDGVKATTVLIENPKMA